MRARSTCAAGRRPELAVEVSSSPAGGERRLDFGERRTRRGLGAMGRFEFRRERGDLRTQRRKLRGVALDQQGHFTERTAGGGEIAGAPLAQFARMLDRLFGARDVRTDLVVATLHG